MMMMMMIFCSFVFVCLCKFGVCARLPFYRHQRRMLLSSRVVCHSVLVYTHAHILVSCVRVSGCVYAIRESICECARVFVCFSAVAFIIFELTHTYAAYVNAHIVEKIVREPSLSEHTAVNGSEMARARD